MLDLLIEDLRVVGALPAFEGHQTSELAVISLARDYGRDADREIRLVKILYVAVGVFVAGSFASILVGLGLSSGQSDPRFWPSLYISILFLFLAVPGWVQAERHRRSAAASRTLERQIAMMDNYLSPLPEPTRALLRGSLVQRFFGRPTFDRDPIGEPIWPTAEQIVKVARPTGQGGERGSDIPT